MFRRDLRRHHQQQQQKRRRWLSPRASMTTLAGVVVIVLAVAAATVRLVQSRRNPFDFSERDIEELGAQIQHASDALTALRQLCEKTAHSPASDSQKAALLDYCAKVGCSDVFVLIGLAQSSLRLFFYSLFRT